MSRDFEKFQIKVVMVKGLAQVIKGPGEVFKFQGQSRHRFKVNGLAVNKDKVKLTYLNRD